MEILKMEKMYFFLIFLSSPMKSISNPKIQTADETFTNTNCLNDSDI